MIYMYNLMNNLKFIQSKVSVQNYVLEYVCK